MVMVLVVENYLLHPKTIVEMGYYGASVMGDYYYFGKAQCIDL